MSSLYRGALFFSTNLVHGLHAALGAMWTEFGYRGITAGFYGAATQAAAKSNPRRAAMATAGILVVSHGIEFMVHWLRHTPSLRSSIAASVCFTLLSTLFNLHAMQRGVLVTGSGSAPFLADLRQLPRTLASFGALLVAAPLKALAAPLKALTIKNSV
jgi:hypothetical protein